MADPVLVVLGIAGVIAAGAAVITARNNARGWSYLLWIAALVLLALASFWTWQDASSDQSVPRDRVIAVGIVTVAVTLSGLYLLLLWVRETGWLKRKWLQIRQLVIRVFPYRIRVQLQVQPLHPVSEETTIAIRKLYPRCRELFSSVHEFCLHNVLQAYDHQRGITSIHLSTMVGLFMNDHVDQLGRACTMLEHASWPEAAEGWRPFTRSHLEEFNSDFSIALEDYTGVARWLNKIMDAISSEEHNLYAHPDYLHLATLHKDCKKLLDDAYYRSDLSPIRETSTRIWHELTDPASDLEVWEGDKQGDDKKNSELVRRGLERIEQPKVELIIDVTETSFVGLAPSDDENTLLVVNLEKIRVLNHDTGPTKIDRMWFEVADTELIKNAAENKLGDPNGNPTIKGRDSESYSLEGHQLIRGVIYNREGPERIRLCLYAIGLGTFCVKLPREMFSLSDE